jgi:N utilization substance protein A
MATVVMPESQLSLAIGKEGQNVRLAAKLTGWKIDIISDAEAAKAKEEGEKGKEGEEEKFKVHGVAKELGISSKELIAKLAEMGVEAKAATSNISKEVRDRLLSEHGGKAG